MDSYYQRELSVLLMNFKETVSKGVLWGSVLMTAAATQLGSCLTNEDVGISAWLTGALEPLTANLPVIGLILFFMTWGKGSNPRGRNHGLV